MFNRLKEYDQGELRNYQIRNKFQVYDLWKEKRAVMLQMPTGTGKTKLFCSMIGDFHKYGAETKKAVKVLVLAHRNEIIEQIYNEIIEYSHVACGIIQAGHKEMKRFPTQVASVMTLTRRLDRWEGKDFDFIIVDEAHHVLAESYKKIIKRFPNAKILGVTATPYRLSGSGFVPEFDDIVISPSIKKFQQEGWLSEYDYYSVKRNNLLQMQVENIAKFNIEGDYDEGELMRICDNDHIRAQVVETYLKYAKGKKGIVYTINKEHNKHICETYNNAGLIAVAIDSDTDADKRSELVDKFREGKIDVLCNVNIFSEGFDCPDIEFIQLARPTKSLALYLQQVGRGLRIHDEKEKCIFLDNVGLYNRFGLPSANRHWHYHFIGNGEVEKHQKAIQSEPLEYSLVEKEIKEGNETVYLIEETHAHEIEDPTIKMFKSVIADIQQEVQYAYDNIFYKQLDEDSPYVIIKVYEEPWNLFVPTWKLRDFEGNEVEDLSWEDKFKYSYYKVLLNDSVEKKIKTIIKRIPKSQMSFFCSYLAYEYPDKLCSTSLDYYLSSVDGARAINYDLVYYYLFRAECMFLDGSRDDEFIGILHEHMTGVKERCDFETKKKEFIEKYKELPDDLKATYSFAVYHGDRDINDKWSLNPTYKYPAYATDSRNIEEDVKLLLEKGVIDNYSDILVRDGKLQATIDITEIESLFHLDRKIEETYNEVVKKSQEHLAEKKQEVIGIFADYAAEKIRNIDKYLIKNPLIEGEEIRFSEDGLNKVELFYDGVSVYDWIHRLIEHSKSISEDASEEKKAKMRDQFHLDLYLKEMNLRSASNKTGRDDIDSLNLYYLSKINELELSPKALKKIFDSIKDLDITDKIYKDQKGQLQFTIDYIAKALFDDIDFDLAYLKKSLSDKIWEIYEAYYGKGSSKSLKSNL